MEKVIAIYKDKPSENVLNEITDFIHDCFFDLEEIRFDTSKRVLTIPFLREFYEQSESLGGWIPGKVKIPQFNCYLNVFHVLKYVINDSEKVGNYDFESILFNEDLNKIKISTNIPLKFEIFIEKFEISLCCDIRPLDYRESRWFGL